MNNISYSHAYSHRAVHTPCAERAAGTGSDCDVSGGAPGRRPARRPGDWTAVMRYAYGLFVGRRDVRSSGEVRGAVARSA